MRMTTMCGSDRANRFKSEAEVAACAPSMAITRNASASRPVSCLIESKSELSEELRGERALDFHHER